MCRLGQGSWSEVSVKKSARLEFAKTEEWTIGQSVGGSDNAAGVASAVDASLPHVAFEYFVVTVGRVTTMDEMKAGYRAKQIDGDANESGFTTLSWRA